MSIAHSYRWVQRGVESPLYSHQCAWCGVKLPNGEVFARPDTAHRTSHGICPKCSAKQHAEAERIRLRHLLDEPTVFKARLPFPGIVPAPAFIAGRTERV